MEEIPESRFPINVKNMDEQFTMLNAISEVNMQELIAQYSNEEICSARDDVVLLVQTVCALEQHSVNEKGETLGAAVLVRCWEQPITQVGMILGWLWLRRNPAMLAGMQTLTGLIRRMQGKAKQETEDAAQAS
jgi:hypothetical protein